MDKNRISESEWKVMNVFWARPGSTANQVIGALSKEKWAAKTIRTLINRLAGKNVLRVDREGLEYKFFPAVEEADCIRSETRSLFEKIRSKATKLLLAAFIEEQDLTEGEIQELKDILDKKLHGDNRTTIEE